MSSNEFEFVKVLRSNGKVRGLTHDFYNYPARFSPEFVRHVVHKLTEPGDYVLDPFMGGGTTVVEAAASGRNAIGSDINELAKFIACVKTTPLSRRDAADIRDWVQKVKESINSTGVNKITNDCPIPNLPIEAYSFFGESTKLANELRFARRKNFARCVLLAVGQWALDARVNTLGLGPICDQLEIKTERMLHGLVEFVSAAKSSGTPKNKITGTRRLMSYSATNPIIPTLLGRRGIRPKLVLTSPPYPGVHVLYHRWQVSGRRETPAPYWIADVQDGHGETYYTMGGRSQTGSCRYFTQLTEAFANLRKLVDPEAHIVQLISFSDLDIQLPWYLRVMEITGFEELNEGEIASRQVRSVPNRKWFNQNRNDNDASKEILLVHRPAQQTRHLKSVVESQRI